MIPYSKSFGEILDAQLRGHIKVNNITLDIITDLENQIKGRDDRIAAFMSTVVDQHTDIQDLKARLSKKDELVATQRALLVDMKGELPRFVVELPNAECVDYVVNRVADAIAKSSGQRFNIQFYVPEGDRDD